MPSSFLRRSIHLVFVCGVLGGYAQDQEKLRNAWQRYHDQALSSHERLVALDDVIYHVSRVGQDSSLGLSRRLLSEARAHGDTLMVGQAFRNIGIATFRTGEKRSPWCTWTVHSAPARCERTPHTCGVRGPH
ncbi:MAG: hypothetical protein IPM68_05670 [Flavobacteriales bacterium]|nr:hypothetical protein [Flavobacteriales bacterium]